MPDAPLKNVRVVDLGCYLAGPLTGMLLADQGADVIKIDPPGGPVYDHPVNAILGRNKTHLALDLKQAADRETAESHIRTADILIENFGPGVMDRLGLGPDRLRALNPNLIMVSLPGFSGGIEITGGTKAYEGIIAAATGQYTDIHAIRTPFGMGPVYTALPMASVYAGVHAATAAVLSLRERAAGRSIAPIRAPLDAASLSAMSSIHMKIEDQPERYKTPRLPKPVEKVALPLLKQAARSGLMSEAKLLDIARKAYPALMTSYPCRDGKLLYIFAVDNGKLAARTLRALGILEAMREEGLGVANPYTSGDRRDNLAETSNLSRPLQTAIKDKIAATLLTRDADVWEHVLREEGVPCTVQRSTQDWLALPELKAAGIIVDVPQEDGSMNAQPGLQVWLSGSPAQLARPRPAQTPVEPPPAWPDRASILANTLPRAPGQWLEGLTVIDMCSMVAGPVAARTLAEYGARIIKIETPSPNHGPRMTCWYGLDVNPGKESVLLDLKTAEGQAVMTTLLEGADILVTNQPEPAMAQMGLSRENLSRDFPALIQARIGAYNGPLEGPWAAYNGYDPVLQAASGIMMRYGDPGQPELHAIASCVDALTGYSAMFGMALALHSRDLTGCGQAVDASLAAAATLVQLPFASTGAASLHEPSGQDAMGDHATCRLYKARDGWIFIAGKPAQLAGLAGAFGLANPKDGQLEQALEKAIRKTQASRAIQAALEAGLSAINVSTVNGLQSALLDRPGPDGLSLMRRNVPGIGPVVSVPALQVQTDAGGLRTVFPAEKSGASTRVILEEFGFSSAHLLQSGAAAEELSDDFLPA